MPANVYPAKVALGILFNRHRRAKNGLIESEDARHGTGWDEEFDVRHAECHVTESCVTGMTTIAVAPRTGNQQVIATALAGKLRTLQSFRHRHEPFLQRVQV